MINNNWIFGFSLLLLVLCLPVQAEDRTSLFDGTSLEGWEGDPAWWRLEDEKIVGGSLKKQMPHNTFLLTESSYKNFVLTLDIRLHGGEGFVNSGIQVRSARVPDSPEVEGYQVDVGDGYWGKLDNEKRRGWLVNEPDDQNRKTGKGDSNETDHGVISKEQKEQAVEAGVQMEIEGKPQSPEEQKNDFILPDGFDIELVAAETERAGKYVDVTWDTAGRMWTVTALAYPLSEGGSPPGPDVRKKYENGGRDHVLIYDDPYGDGPHEARSFANDLVQPLSVLPLRSGAFVQHGPDIRYYRDQDGDGSADDYEVTLNGLRDEQIRDLFSYLQSLK